MPKLKKISTLISSLLICYSLGYSEEQPEVVSQDGPLGATSIGEQDLNDSKNSKTNKKNNNLNEKELLLKLQQQVELLQGQLKEIKTQQSNLKNTSGNPTQFITYSSKVDSNEKVRIAGANTDLSKSLISDEGASDMMSNISSDNSIISLGEQPLGGIFNPKGGIDVGGAPAITTQGQVTFLGSYSGNNSIPIGQISSNLFASTLIGQREKFDDYSIFFGGFLEADASVWFGSNGITNVTGGSLSDNGQNIYLTGANLYFLSNLGHYVTAQFDFDTDESGTFGLGNAFVMFGNLDTSPFFVTAGRNKISVGTYGGGGTWTSGLVKNFLAPGQVSNVSVNYKDQVWNANVSVFGADDQEANFSTGLFYADSWTESLAAGFNVGYVYNMASAGNGALNAFLTDSNGNRTKKTIGAFNVDGNLTYGLFGGFLNVGGGWSTTTNKANFNDKNNINSESVLAGAWYVASNYSLNLGGRDTNFGVSYGQSYNAAEIPMALSASPINAARSESGIKHQLIFSAQRAYFDDNVLFGPEYVYQELYDGNHLNTITLDMSVYI